MLRLLRLLTAADANTSRVMGKARELWSSDLVPRRSHACFLPPSSVVVETEHLGFIVSSRRDSVT